MTALPTEVTARALEFNEAQHPRVRTGPQGGQFTSGSGGGTASSPARQPYQPPTSRPDRFTRRGSSGSGSSAAPRTKYTTTLKMGKDNDPEAVKQLQAMLGELGLGRIAVDGLFGTQTEAAVKAAQQKLGLKPNGSASASLLNRLHDAHTLSPCIDRAQSKVAASAMPVAAAAGRDVTPGHDELHHWWTKGPGLARWAGSPRPWTTLVALLTEHVGPLKARTFASRWYIEVFGYSAGSDRARVAHGKPPRGKLIGPG